MIHHRFFIFSYISIKSNVAVGRNFRRRGIAEDLIKKLEDIAMDWGYDGKQRIMGLVKSV